MKTVRSLTHSCWWNVLETHKKNSQVMQLWAGCGEREEREGGRRGGKVEGGKRGDVGGIVPEMFASRDGCTWRFFVRLPNLTEPVESVLTQLFSRMFQGSSSCSRDNS